MNTEAAKIPMKHYEDGGPKLTPADEITLKLPVVIGLFLTFAGICAGGFSVSIWWASSISTKMDVVVTQGVEQSTSTKANALSINALQLWQQKIETVGSPAMAARMNIAEKDIIQLGEELRLHKATSIK